MATKPTKSNVTALQQLLGGRTMTDLAEDRSSIIPSGFYHSIVDKVEVNTSRTGNMYLSIWHKLDGNENYDGAYVFNNLNIGHPKAEARAQAEGALKSLLACAGMADTEQGVAEMVEALPGCSSHMYVSQQAGSNGYAPRNNVSRYVTAAEISMRDKLNIDTAA